MELKPCPFCGGKPEFLPNKENSVPWGIKCSVCGIKNEGHWSYNDAVNTWNTRAVANLQEQLRVALDDRDRLYEVLTEIVAASSEQYDLVNGMRKSLSQAENILKESALEQIKGKVG